VIKSTRPSIVRDKKAIAPPPLIVPSWAVAVFATFDTQPDWLKYVIRAWGGGLKSQLIVEGEIHEATRRWRPDKRKQWVWDEVCGSGWRAGSRSRAAGSRRRR
jgi:hypothetical protein